jgi:arylsulfatase A-like enzyme
MALSRFVFRVGVCLPLLLAAGCAGNEDTASMDRSRTSVLWLTLCTLRADHLGAYGYEHDVSPFIDSAAEKGVLFERAVAAAPWTRSSIAASSTGLYPRTLNIEEPTDGPNNRQLLGSFRTLAEVLQEEGYHTIGISANPSTHSVFNFDQGFDHYEDTGKFQWRTGYGDRKRTAEEVNAGLLERLRKAGPDTRFFAHLTYVDVHEPLADQVVAGRFPGLAASLGNEDTEGYDLQIRYLDSSIARLLQNLEAMGFEDLLVIITADHGEAFGERHPGDWGHGLTLYNETIRVPFIFFHPALERVRGRRSPLVNLVSLMPTVLDLLGIEYESPHPGGTSLADLVRASPDAKAPDRTVVETCFKVSNLSTVLESDWKLIATYPNGANRPGEPYAYRYELFRLDRDREEADDLAARMPDEVKRLSALLAGWQADHDLVLPPDSLDVVVPDHVIENLKSLGYVN